MSETAVVNAVARAVLAALGVSPGSTLINDVRIAIAAEMKASGHTIVSEDMASYGHRRRLYFDKREAEMLRRSYSATGRKNTPAQDAIATAIEAIFRASDNDFDGGNRAYDDGSSTKSVVQIDGQFHSSGLAGGLLSCLNRLGYAVVPYNSVPSDAAAPNTEPST